MPRFETRQIELGPGPSAGAMLLDIHFSSYFKTLRGKSPPLPACGKITS